jgi:hypothetical protein
MRVARDALSSKKRTILGVENAADDRFSRVNNLKKIEPFTEESSGRDGFQLPVANSKRLNSAGGCLK